MRKEKRISIFNKYYNHFYNLIANNILWVDLPAEIPFRWATKLILEDGKFAIFENQYLKINGTGATYPLYEYGEQTSFLLSDKSETNEFMWNQKEGVNVIGANDLRTSPLEMLRLLIDKIVSIDIAMEINLSNIKKAKVIGVKDKNTKLSVQKTFDEIDAGVNSVFVAKDFFKEDNVKIFDFSSELQADKLQELRTNLIAEIYSYYGLSTSPQKKERVQVGEIENTQMISYDNIFTIIDSINKDFEKANLKTRVRFNGALNDYKENRELENQNYVVGEQQENDN